ncbi:hypothetical protein HPB48_015438 [Haemaphysalis longicornis]|uniref:Uncharacterized protein n=1 Tax=Haemaphysalis longicornis TaxID=44386 RepID=A0A9J6GLI9_HAELO|nr:hypothetical protein HPB48_015438 [Haemaphysalis longicornis]
MLFPTYPSDGRLEKMPLVKVVCPCGRHLNGCLPKQPEHLFWAGSRKAYCGTQLQICLRPVFEKRLVGPGCVVLTGITPRQHGENGSLHLGLHVTPPPATTTTPKQLE